MAKVHQNSTIAEIFYMPLKMLKGSKKNEKQFLPQEDNNGKDAPEEQAEP